MGVLAAVPFESSKEHGFYGLIGCVMVYIYSKY